MGPGGAHLLKSMAEADEERREVIVRTVGKNILDNIFRVKCVAYLWMLTLNLEPISVQDGRVEML